jgi:prepilin-type N-terminal cleavage/methylation domain-containing protein
VNFGGDKGFTLTELLVSMLMGLVVLAGIYSLYITTAQVTASQGQLMETQQNVRIALELLVEDLQAVGGTGIPAAAAVILSNSTTNPDSINLLIPDPICPPPKPRIVPIQTYNGSAANMFLAAESTCPEMDGKVAIAAHSNGIDYRTIQITQVTTTNDKINFSPGLSPVNSPGGLGADYSGGTLVLVRQTRYAINLSDQSKPVLEKDLNDGTGAQPIANYIEDLQISLGYDRNNDGMLPEIGTSANDDEWVFNVAGESNAGEAPTNLRAVKVIIAGRTRLPDTGFAGLRPALLDRGAGAADGYRRRVKGARVRIRNFGN